MNTTIEISGKLRDLIVANTRRYESYKVAAEETDDEDLKAIFNEYSEQSKIFKDKLKDLLSEQRDFPEPGSENIEKIHYIFSNVEEASHARDRKGILSSCQFSEGTANQIYDDFLSDTEGIEHKTVGIVREQKEELRKAHDKIKMLRDTIYFDK